jgi:hypothetical protein
VSRFVSNISAKSLAETLKADDFGIPTDFAFPRSRLYLTYFEVTTQHIADSWTYGRNICMQRCRCDRISKNMLTAHMSTEEMVNLMDPLFSIPPD